MLLAVLAAAVLVVHGSPAAPAITSPNAYLGFDIGSDYQLANYTQFQGYWKKLDQESDRLTVVEYGKTSEGRPMIMAIITSPENQKKLDHYKNISRRLALAEGLTDNEARALAAEGKAVVWIDGGLHASEVANAQALTEMVYQMASRTDAETLRFLNDVIFLAAFSNPDGLELVANWYMREKEPTRRSTANLPVLYQKYIGHDNNRESLLMNMPESHSIGRVLYHEWFPQIMYNQHQTGPAGAILFIGHMRSPNNPNLDPLIAPSTELVSAAIHSRFIVEGKPGATSRSMSSYQNWWNGGVRSTTTFHNQIGILSEISGNPTPIDVAFIPKNLVASNDNPFPVQPQRWHFRQTIEYLITAERAILDIASKSREDFLFNVYRMGKNSIDRGSKDTWTMTARKIAAVQEAITKDQVRAEGRGGFPMKYYEPLRDPALRDPRGYVIPSDQADFLTATKFVNALIKNGVTVHRATQPFQISGKKYPAGSYVVKNAQAFRPHVLDNFEPQDYPDDFEYPGGPPIRPYDVTGYTLALQMGVQFDRILDGFEGPFQKVDGFARPPAGQISGAGSAGFLLSHQLNDSFAAINRLLASGEDVYWLKSAVRAGSKTYPAGAIYIPAKSSTAAAVQKLVQENALSFDRLDMKPAGDALRLKPLRIGVVDVYGGSMPSGWVQWMFGQYAFPYEVVYPPTLDIGSLKSKFDVLVFENGIIPGQAGGRGSAQPQAPPNVETIPAEYRARMGAVSQDKTIPQLRQFLADGGTILAIGGSTSLGYALDLPIANALVEEGTTRPLPPEKFYAPGAIFKVRVDTSNPLAYGMPEQLDIFYDNNPVFQLKPGTGIQRVAWFDSDKPLRSGWAWNQKYLNQGVAVAEAQVGKGKLFLFGPLIAFRAHPHATFKFLFNGVYYGGAEAVKLPPITTF
ncbi:MAG: peptidase [Acidobacteria bacterium]|nr:peptidase [Acidobacteriota bacterium]